MTPVGSPNIDLVTFGGRRQRTPDRPGQRATLDVLELYFAQLLKYLEFLEARIAAATLLIDGGKGQLGAALEALNEIGLSAVGSNFGGGGGRGICVSPGGNDQGQAMAVVSLAKRLEEVCDPPPSLSLL